MSRPRSENNIRESLHTIHEDMEDKIYVSIQYHNSNKDIYNRNMRWKIQKEYENNMKKIKKQEKEEECLTF